MLERVMNRILNFRQREAKPNPVLNDVRTLKPILECLDKAKQLEILNDKLNQWARAEIERARPIFKSERMDINEFPLKKGYPFNLVLTESLLAPQQDGKINVVAATRDGGYRQIQSEVKNAKEENTWVFVPFLSLWINDRQSSDISSAGGG